MNRALPRRLPPFLLTLLAAALHLWALDAQSLWYDEGFSVWLAQQPVSQIVAITAADIQPPLYYFLLHGWLRMAGPSEWSVRFLSACFAVLAVPLLWQVAWRLLRQQAAAHAAAALVALSPLWLWYGREARNYTLGLALLLAAAWLLLSLLDPARPLPARRRSGQALAFALLLAAGLYTHYFILFVWAGWALTALASWLRRPQRPHLPPLALAFGLPLLLYLPWVGVGVTRLGEDRSYWEGTLSVREVVGEALGSWMAGHSMHEATAVPLGVLGAILAGVGLLVLAWRTTPRPPSLFSRPRPTPVLGFHHGLLVTLWLLAPLVGLLLVAWDRPKYNPRYLMFAAPAFLLCFAALIGWLWARSWAGRLASLGVTLLLLGIFGVADWNLFTDPAFAKADWRGAAAHLHQERQPNEPLLLVSGHAFPVLDYYYPSQPDSPTLRLPPERTLDTTAVLGLEVSESLTDALADAPGLWLVTWQDEVVDPDGVIPALLRAAGATRVEGPSLMEVRLTHWRLPPAADLRRALRPAHPLETRFGDALHLVGWSSLPTPAPADEGLALVLYWLAPRPLSEDYKVRLTVVDEAGFEYGTLDQRPTSYNFPTFRWQAGEVRLATLEVPLAPGTPPGDYWLELSVYPEGTPANLDILDAAGAPQGQTVRFGPVAVAPPSQGWLGVGAPADATPIDQPLLDEQRLLAARLALPAELEPGQRFPLALWWRTAGALPGATLHMGWAHGTEVIASAARPVAGAGWAGERWRPGDLLLSQFTVQVPRDLEPGNVRLVVWLTDAQGRASAPVPLASREVIAAPRSFRAPTVPIAQPATFGETIRLLGYDLAAPLEPGQPTTLTVYWEALGEMEQSLSVFAHVLGGTGTLIAEAGQDKLPLNGERPTDSWLAGEFLTDTFTLTLPAAPPPGPYTIELGWYDAALPTFPRLPAQGVGADGDRVLIR